MSSDSITPLLPHTNRSDYGSIPNQKPRPHLIPPPESKFFQPSIKTGANYYKALAYQEIDEFFFRNNGDNKTDDSNRDEFVKEKVKNILSLTEPNFKNLDTKRNEEDDDCPISRNNLELLFYLFYMHQKNGKKFEFNKAIFSEFNAWVLRCIYSSEKPIEQYYVIYFCYIEKNKSLQEKIDVQIDSNFSKKEKESYDKKIELIENFVASKPDDARFVKIKEEIESNPLIYLKRLKSPEIEKFASIHKSYKNLNPQLEENEIALAADKESGDDVDNEKKGDGFFLPESKIGLGLRIETDEGAKWQRYNKLETNPTTVRDVSAEEGMEINNGCHINNYDTEAEIQIGTFTLKTHKSRSGAPATLYAAYQNLFKIMNDNKEKDIIHVFNSRYIASFENYSQELISNYLKLYNEAIDSITDHVDGKKIIRIEKIKLLFAQEEYKKLENMCLDSEGRINVDAFLNKINNKELNFVPASLSPNNRALNLSLTNELDIGFGFYDSENRANIQKIAHTFENEHNKKFPPKEEKANTDSPKQSVTAEEQKEQISKFWFQELKKIASPPSFFSGWSWKSPLRAVVKLTIGVVAVTGLVISGTIKAFAACLNRQSKIIDLAFDGSRSVLKAIWNHIGNGGEFISGEKSFYTDTLMTCLGGLYKIVTEGACKSNKDRGSAAQIAEAIILSVFHHRAKDSERKKLFDVNDYSFLNFSLRDEAEREIARKILEENIPFLVTLYNTGVPGSKSLDGVMHFIEQTYSDPENIENDKELKIKKEETINLLKGFR